MINRRGFLGVAAGAGAALALVPERLRAFQQSGGTLIQRAIPATGEMLPSSDSHSRTTLHAPLTPCSRRSGRSRAARGGEMVSQPQQNPAATGTSGHSGAARGAMVPSTPSCRPQWPEALKNRWEMPVGAGHASPLGSRAWLLASTTDGNLVSVKDVDKVICWSF